MKQGTVGLIQSVQVKKINVLIKVYRLITDPSAYLCNYTGFVDGMANKF